MRRKRQKQYTVWYDLDSTMCGAVLLIGLLPMLLFPPYRYIVGCVFPAAAFLVFGKKLYEKDRQRSAVFRRVTGSIRAVLYILAIGGMLPACTMFLRDVKWAYPVQRMVYLSHYGAGSTPEMILPKQLPKKTENYTATLMPKFVRGAAVIDISYVTDGETLNSHCAYAENQGAAHIFAGDAEWSADMERYHASEAYIFSDGGVWMLNPETGRFRIYWVN